MFSACLGQGMLIALRILKVFLHLSPSRQDFSKPVGSLSQSVFIPGSSQALTGTSEGCGVVWEDVKPVTPGESKKINFVFNMIIISNCHTPCTSRVVTR